MSESELARGSKNLTPSMDLDQAKKELIRELLEAKVPLDTIKLCLDIKPTGVDKRLTAPLAIRSRRARILITELFFWSREGERVDKLIDELNYLTGISQRTLMDYWAGIKLRGRVREHEGRVKRCEI